jgi:ABC-type bacteriocin/lantibiotic exporter with double-glycine peptidase domain
LEEQTAQSQNLGASNTKADPGQILLDNVTAAWPGADIPTLKKLNCKLEGDNIVVIVGSVGAGKVTKSHA